MSWPLVAIGDVAEVLSGNAWKSSQFTHEAEGRLPILRIQNVSNAATDFVYWDGVAVEKYIIKNGDLLLSLSGNVKLCEWSFGNALLNQRIVKLAPVACIDRRYFYWSLHRVVSEIEAMARHAVIANVSVADLKEFQIPLPPLPEQKRIAAVLDKADAIRRKRQQAIQLADDFLRAVFLDMFGDPGANPKGFNEAVLGELTTGRMNNGLFRKNDEYGGAVPVAWVGELFRGNQISFSEGANRIDPTENEIESYGLKHGDLLFCRSSLKLEGIGFNNIYLGDDDKALFECHLIRISPCLKKVNPVFLSYQLRMPSIRSRVFQQAKTSTMTTIDQAGLSRIKVVIPSLDLQKEFERIIIRVESLYLHLYRNKSMDDLAFSAISQKAFSGHL